jgi:uncharacterized membrane protein YbhN (UPF0104 family)
MSIRNNKYLRIGLLVLTLAAFVYYFLHNKEGFSRIGDLTLWQVVLVIIGQSIVIFSNILVLIIFGRFIEKHVPFAQSARITAYSSLINFFGFLQGGVGLRGLYLRRDFGMPLRQYAALTTVQYLILFSIAGSFLIIGIGLSASLWQALFLLLVIAAGLLGVTMLYRMRLPFVVRQAHRLNKLSVVFKKRPLASLLGVIVLQLCGSLLANSVELSAIGASISLGSLLIYTGIAQFAIVIALTPGAVGIREGLLLIVQGQMHLTSQDIVVASTIDRIVYFITLALITPLALGAKRKLTSKN